MEYKFKQDNILYWIQPSPLYMHGLWAKNEGDITWKTIIGGGQNTFEQGCPTCQMLMAELMRLEGEKDK